MAVNESQFRSMKPIGDDIYEVRSAHRRIKIDVVMTNGINILFEAKLLLLKWHYSFLSYFIPKQMFVHILGDTDSMYSAFGAKSLSDSVHPHKKAEFEHLRKGYCGKKLPANAMLPRTCCSDCNLEDQKEPGLFKREATADIVIALTSKTYVCVDSKDKVKLSCKGVNKKIVARNSPLDIFRRVFETRQSEGSENRGFRSIKGQTFTYTIFREAFPWLYLKRDVLAGGSYTKTLPVVLQPCPKIHLSLQTDLKELGPDHIIDFEYAGYKVKTIRQAHCLMKYIYCVRYNVLRENHLLLLSQILKETAAKEVNDLLVKMGYCEEWCKEEYNTLYYIVLSRMTQHPDLHNLLDIEDQRYIVNACSLNKTMGNGESPGVTRYRKDAFLQGGNYLGKIYMIARTTLKSIV